jgi:hypothetical protein
MSRRPFKIVFSDKNKLEAMIELRKQGWTYHSLALVFGVDFSSIYHECKKFHVEKGKDNIDFTPRSIIHLLEIKAQEPKMYADYLREYKSQRFLR